ncbi:hypothetical protein ACVWXN_001574 [Bradyrhizobium sp. i1.4.4]|uniref:hypothetical protein n=1 Tax=Bradyrhizobium sp. RT10b TaxID=3156331 RepID=UPI0033993EE6
MQSWTLSRTLGLGLGLLALYFPVAIYLKYSYFPPPEPPVIRTFMLPPFTKVDGDGHAYQASSEYIASLDALADSRDDSASSPILIYENDKPLGPAHSSHEDIEKIGYGRFSHWRGMGIIFSASDVTDPNTNGRRYTVVVPK